jgi:hypothetical protein
VSTSVIRHVIYLCLLQSAYCTQSEYALDDVDSVWYVSISCTNDWPKSNAVVVHSNATLRTPLPIYAHRLSMYRLQKVFEVGL